MKYCRTLDGLLKAIEKGEQCCLKYTHTGRTISDEMIIYQANGTNLFVTNTTYEKIKPFLKQV